MPGESGHDPVGAAEPPPPRHEAVRDSYLIVDDFLPLDDALALRAHVDAHFGRPEAHEPATHQIWNYWYIPNVYTYLRTMPERIVPTPLVDDFHARLCRWASERLGLSNVTRPYLSLYVDGCAQGLHNDSANGRFGYVYSLTKDGRASGGGQTMLLKEGDLFRSRLARADGGTGLYDLIEPQFNRLTVFDDRMPHGVQRVEGTMDPFEGRIVMHGHISEGDALLSGPLDCGAVEQAVFPIVIDLLDKARLTDVLYHGPLVLRLFVDPAGEVAGCDVLVDRVARSDGGSARTLADAIVEAIAAIRFPSADGPSEVTLPLMIGGPLPRTPRD